MSVYLYQITAERRMSGGVTFMAKRAEMSSAHNKWPRVVNSVPKERDARRDDLHFERDDDLALDRRISATPSLNFSPRARLQPGDCNNRMEIYYIPDCTIAHLDTKQRLEKVLEKQIKITSTLSALGISDKDLSIVNLKPFG
jgi:hypothetical protein